MKTIKLPLDLYDIPPGTKIYNKDQTKFWILFYRQVVAKLDNVEPDSFHLATIPMLVNPEADTMGYLFPDSVIQVNGGTLYYEEEA